MPATQPMLTRDDMTETVKKSGSVILNVIITSEVRDGSIVEQL